jgi:hypothetical protein
MHNEGFEAGSLHNGEVVSVIHLTFIIWEQDLTPGLMV